MTRMGYPLSELTGLLDALERELLTAHADEVYDAWRETGRARNIACQEVRAVLNEAIAASEDCSAAMPPPDTCSRTGWIGFLAFRGSCDLRFAGRNAPITPSALR